MLIWYLFTMRSAVKVNRREWEAETMKYFIELWKIAFYKLIICYLLGRRAFTGRLTQCQYFIFIGLKCYMNALDISLLVRIPYNFLLFDYTHSMRHWKASTCAKMFYYECMNQYWLVTTKWKIVHALFSSIDSQRTHTTFAFVPHSISNKYVHNFTHIRNAASKTHMFERFFIDELSLRFLRLCVFISRDRPKTMKNRIKSTKITKNNTVP